MSAMKKTVLTVVCASLMTMSALAPAVADDKPGKKDDKAKPPANMSTVGGAQLGKAGTQVNLGAGAPVLPKALSGRSWIVADAESGDVLASHNAHWRLPPASTLKMLFADTVLKKGNLPKDKVYEVKDEDLADVGEGSSLVGVKEDHTYTVHDLWLGVFLRSGNDAVHVLANMNGGLKQTVSDMQEHAEELQALDTQVVSPDGYDAEGQVSSAYDLTLFARSGLQDADFREYASTARAQFPGEGKGKKRDHFEIQNTNRLLTGDYGLNPYKGIAGVKNGNTTHAGATFTGVAERDGKVLLVTVMNPSSDEQNAVYEETARLFDWGFKAADKVTPVGELVPPRSVDTSGGGKGAAAPEQQKKESGTLKGAEKAAAEEGSSGVGIALAITGGVLLLVGAGVFVVNRRWPLPDLVRKLPRR
ncbi:D-alanyl-D-alanine carboxypeptidase family protein [Streptomyces sp. NPDC050418]|uniref:D-alanyl-D-alanine carboxypeptidase family protein n=1 Tax=Streptomyces sp. NPDC050418 TaxID=3365612 RepID=UPI003793DC29